VNKKGFTLVELITVIALLAILMAIATPSFMSWRESAQYKEVARDVLSGLRRARSLAVSENRTVNVTLNPATHILTVDGSSMTLHENVSVQASGDNLSGSDPDQDDCSTGMGTGSITRIFYPQGTCDKHFYVLINNDSSLCVRIESTATGLARL